MKTTNDQTYTDILLGLAKGTKPPEQEGALALDKGSRIKINPPNQLVIHERNNTYKIETNYNTLLAKTKNLSNNLEEAQKRNETMEKELSVKFKKEREEIELELLSLKMRFVETENKLVEVTTLKNETERALIKANSDLDLLNSKLREENEKYSVKLKTLQEKHMQLKISNEALNAEFQAFKMEARSKERIQEDSIRLIKEKLTQKKIMKKHFKEENKDLKFKLKNCQDSVEINSALAQKKSSEIERYLIDISAREKEITVLQFQIDKNKEKNDKLTNLKEERTELRIQTAQQKEEIMEMKRYQESLKKDLLKLQYEMKNLEEDKERYEGEINLYKKLYEDSKFEHNSVIQKYQHLIEKDEEKIKNYQKKIHDYEEKVCELQISVSNLEKYILEFKSFLTSNNLDYTFNTLTRLAVLDNIKF